MSESLEISCRLCLEENCKDLFHDLLLEEGNNRSNKALNEIFRINITDNATLPQKICLECNNLLTNFYEFYLEVMKNQAKLILGINSASNACQNGEHESPQPSNIVDDEPPELHTASQDSQISTSNQNNRRRKRKRRGGSTHRERELTPLSTESEDDELPLSVLVRRPSSPDKSPRQKYSCQECAEEFDKIYLYETHKETVHSSYPVDASPNIDTIKIILHSGSVNMLKFKCKLCTFQSESQWETRRHQSTMHNGPVEPRPGGQKLVKVLSLNAIAERVPLIKKNKNLTADQRLKMFYGFSCSRCKPPLELSSLNAFENHSAEKHNLTDISWLCCEVKLRKQFLEQHLNYHLGSPYIGIKRDNSLFNSSQTEVVNAIKEKTLGELSVVDVVEDAKKSRTVKKKGGWPKGKPRKVV